MTVRIRAWVVSPSEILYMFRWTEHLLLAEKQQAK